MMMYSDVIEAWCQQSGFHETTGEKSRTLLFGFIKNKSFYSTCVIFDDIFVIGNKFILYD